ncbi:TonB-dependent receptor [Marinicella gelatinilytica]|uniref:TonB-dependent receptor n=1 Tax=Marinicella gelatinilytica TaxID=2996017 RepID=UPI002260DB8B|nr:TonB-dependent receptor [Marinicella gelatinilytica]MCX7545676.1 TonB-dependent receptor [Marinicella gelatinilytica]
MMNIKYFSVHILLATTCLFMADVKAQTENNTSENMAMDEMVVIGSRTPTEISQIPGTVWVIDTAEIQQQADSGADLKTALGRLVPGLDLAPQGRTNFGQNLRGRSVQVLIDGVSMNGSRGLSRQFDAIDLFNIARIEVLSGASSLYGGSATGGIINIITKSGDGGDLSFETQAQLKSGFNSSDDLQKQLAQSISGGNENAQARLGISVTDNDRFYDGSGNEIFPDITQTDLQDNRMVDVLGRLRVNLTETQTLDFGGQFYRSGFKGDRDVFFPGIADNPVANLNGAEIRDGFDSDREPATDRELFNIQYHNSNLWNQDFYLQAFYRNESSAFHAFPYPFLLAAEQRFAIQFAASEQNTRQTGLKALFDKRINDRFRISYGLDFEREQFNANQMFFDFRQSDASGGLVQRQNNIEDRYPTYDVDGLAGYVQSDWQITDAFKLTGGLRYQHTDVSVNDFIKYGYSGFDETRIGELVPGGSNDYDSTLINLSGLYDFGRHQTWLRFSQGFELPDPAKYYGKSPDINVNDNPLTAIKTDQAELGWRYMNDRISTQWALYYAWSDKAVENTDDLAVIVVDEDKRDFGLEGAFNYYADHGFEYGGTMHWVRSDQKNANDEWKRQDARYASVSSLTAFAGWSDNSHEVRIQGNRAFDLKDSAGRDINGQTTFDLVASKNTGFGRFTLGIENLLDNSYSTIWGQRAGMFYASYGPPYLFDFQGRGRTFALNWSYSY